MTISQLEAISFEREHIVELVRRYGGVTTDAVLDPNSTIFQIPNVEGFISYKDSHGTIVAFGDPICSVENVPSLTEAFLKFARQKKSQIIFVGASQEFAQYAKSLEMGVLQLTNHLSLNPLIDDPRKKNGTHASLVRRKTKQALREGVLIHEYKGSDFALEKAIDQLGKEWVASRKGPQIHISNVYLFADRKGKRWFYAKKEETIIGVLVLNELECHKGFLLNHLMVKKNAPNGTPELLIASVIETLGKEECTYLTFGIVPAKSVSEIIHFNTGAAWMFRLFFQIFWRLFDLGRYAMFWNKFLPKEEKNYLLFSPPKICISAVRGLLKSFNLHF